MAISVIKCHFDGYNAENYEIIVYEADSSATNFFSFTIQSWKDALSYPVLEPVEIPTEVIDVDQIVVSLQNQSRGVLKYQGLLSSLNGRI